MPHDEGHCKQVDTLGDVSVLISMGFYNRPMYGLSEWLSTLLNMPVFFLSLFSFQPGDLDRTCNSNEETWKIYFAVFGNAP